MLLIVFRYGSSPIATRVLTAGLFLGLSGLLIYFPLFWAVTLVARPITVQVNAGTIEQGDVLLENQMAYGRRVPKPGDVVLYFSREYRHSTPGSHVQYMMEEGERIDRVLAGPGSDVRWEDGKLYVDGAESTLKPLNPDRAPAELTVQVPPGYYLIFPTSVPQQIRPREWPKEYLREICLVSVEEIRGKIYFRTQPLLRWGRLE